MPKSPDAFRTISEVADWLGAPAHVLRFWESRFAQVKPVKRAGGRRYYRPSDMMLLGGIRKLLHDDGITIKGVQKILRERGVKYVASLSEDPNQGDHVAAATPEHTPHDSPAVDSDPLVLKSTERIDEHSDTDASATDETGQQQRQDDLDHVLAELETAPSEEADDPDDGFGIAPSDPDDGYPLADDDPDDEPAPTPTFEPLEDMSNLTPPERISALYMRLKKLRDRMSAEL